MAEAIARPIGNPMKRVFGILDFFLFGAGTSSLAWIGQTWAAFAVLLVMGILNGYLSILLITGLQRNTPRKCWVAL